MSPLRILKILECRSLYTSSSPVYSLHELERYYRIKIDHNKLNQVIAPTAATLPGIVYFLE